MENSHIQWCDHTFNPWIGCTKVAPECKFCYAEEQQDHRYGRVKWGKGQPRHRTSADYWKQPIAWNKTAICECGYAELIGSDDCRNCGGHFSEERRRKPRVFCASLADVFDEEVDVNWRLDLFSLIMQTTNLDWLLLTKRPAAAKRFLNYGGKPPFGNVWLGVSAGVDPAPLLEIPATVHFLSCEPMLKPLDDEQSHIIQQFDWIIFGGESGSHARLCQLEWIGRGIEFCRFYDIAPFVKQLGTHLATQLRMKDRKGGDLDEWPEDLRVREFPQTEAIVTA